MRIEDAIPHRPPFLLIDEIVTAADDRIVARAVPRADGEFFSGVFRGHYPDCPIVPGVLLCEMVFQAAGVLMSRRLDGKGKVPVLVRIRDARFREMVRPDDELSVEAELEERVSNALYMKGAVMKNGRVAVRVKFVSALVDRE